MSYTPIAPGTLNWDVPVNAAFVSQDARITVNEGAIAALDTTLGQLTFNVKDFGAVGDDATDDGPAIRNAIAAAQAAGGGTVFFPPGNYAAGQISGVCLAVPSFVRIVGAGRQASRLRRISAGSILLDLSGPSTDGTGATHNKYGGAESITLNGNSQTGTVLRSYYSNNHIFRDVLFTSSAERLVDGVEFWDSRFYNCQFESSGGTNGATLPGVHLRNASAASGFGFSADNVNQIVFNACRWENFHNGALRIEDGSVVGNNPNTIYVVDCKMETSQMQGGEHLSVDDSCISVWVDRLYCYAGDFAGGFTTAQNVIDWSASRSTLENIHISNGSVATINSGVVAFSPAGQRTTLRDITSQYSTAPTGNHIFFVPSAGAWLVENCYSGVGSQLGGTIPTAWEGYSPTKLIAGAASDAGFVLAPPNGTLAVDSSSNALAVRVANVWKPIVRTGRAVLVAGTVTVADTGITANSNIQLTSQIDGGTPGFLRVSARTAGVNFTITSSNAADTSTVAYTITEP